MKPSKGGCMWKSGPIPMCFQKDLMPGCTTSREAIHLGNTLTITPSPGLPGGKLETETAKGTYDDKS